MLRQMASVHLQRAEEAQIDHKKQEMLSRKHKKENVLVQ